MKLQNSAMSQHALPHLCGTSMVPSASNNVQFNKCGHLILKYLHTSIRLKVGSAGQKIQLVLPRKACIRGHTIPGRRHNHAESCSLHDKQYSVELASYIEVWHRYVCAWAHLSYWQCAYFALSDPPLPLRRAHCQLSTRRSSCCLLTDFRGHSMVAVNSLKKSRFPRVNMSATSRAPSAITSPMISRGMAWCSLQQTKLRCDNLPT